MPGGNGAIAAAPRAAAAGGEIETGAGGSSMREAKCTRWMAEIVECTRTASEPGADLRDHLRECSRCRERRDDERRLSAQMRVARDAARVHRPGEARRSRIVAQFEMAQRRSMRPLLKWAMAAAAILLLPIGFVEVRRSRVQPTIAQESAE